MEAVRTKEETKAYNDSYRAAHKDEIKASGKAYRSSHKDEIKAYWDSHKEKYKISQANWYKANKSELKIAAAAYYKENKEKINAKNKKWNEDHKEKMIAYRYAHRAANSVRNHYYYIYSNSPRRTNYEGMPFFDGWNPNKGGSFGAGEDWIIKNLGERPDGTTLHIVNHDLGFVPGNLEWTHPLKQSHQQAHKIIAQQRNRIAQLEEQNKNLKELLGSPCAVL